MSDLFDDLGATDRKISRRERIAKERAAVRKARKKRRRILVFLVAVIVAALSAAGYVLLPRFFAGSSVVEDYQGPGGDSVTVVIPQGATGAQIAAILKDAGVIASTKPFIDAYKADPRAQSDIDPGTYSLKLKMSAAAALAALMNDESKDEIKVTIPEGFTKQQVYERLANLLQHDLSAVEAAAADTAALGLPSVAGGNIEGWVAPLTYTFAPGTTPADALRQMITERVSQMKQLEIPEEQWQTVLIKASILDREVHIEQYYPMVARVIENRLADTTQVNGRLQMDSTVLYGAGGTKNIPTAADLEDTSNPYNTYVHTGLPPSPIGAASSIAINAVLHPAEGSWLYFVTVNLTTGETKFASTLEEHNANVAELRAWKAANPDPTPTS